MRWFRRPRADEPEQPPAGPADTGDLGVAVAELEQALQRFDELWRLHP